MLLTNDAPMIAAPGPIPAMGTRVRLAEYDQRWYSRGRSALVVALWDLVQTFLIAPSPHGFYGWRRWLYRRFGADVGRGARIRKGVRCNYPWKVRIGEDSWIGDGVELYALDRISIGSNVVVSQQAYLCTGSHDLRDPRFGLITRPVTIADGAWIALGALVMPGVTVGFQAVIGARAVLTRNAEPGTIYRGCPATACGRRQLRDPEDEG